MLSNTLLSQSAGRAMLDAVEVEAARQHLSSMIRGIPLLSMLPALQHLAPGIILKFC